MNCLLRELARVSDEERLDQFHKQAAERYEKQIPPGYSDLKKKDPPYAYCDYVAWRQLMDIAAREKKDFILVTDDSKEDWWLTLNGRTVGPRPELLEEFRRETGQRVWVLSSESFLRATREAGSADIAESIIKEVSANLVAQSQMLVSEVKLSRPMLEHVEVNVPASELKLSTSRIDSEENEVSTVRGRTQRCQFLKKDPGLRKANDWTHTATKARKNERNSIRSGGLKWPFGLLRTIRKRCCRR